MTQPGGAGALPPLFDPANIPSGKVPVSLVVGKFPAPDGEIGVATIRTANGITLPLLLDKAEAAEWAQNFATLRDALSGGNLVIPQRGDAMLIADAARNDRRP